MKFLLHILIIISGLSLVVAVLLHSAKGEGLGGIGGSARLFSSQKGLEAGLNRVTAVLAGVFMVSALLLSAIQ
ncbi:preprotein translocase subunit SecG [bacterium]|nr:preprotein translocase subunit SecG [bacterium]